MKNQENNRQKALIFDFGGVLVDWNPRYLYEKFFDGDERGMQRFLDEIGFAEWNLQQDKGRPFAEAVAELSGRFPQYAELIRAYDLRWEESISGPIQPTVEILGELKQAGYPLYGLSNWSEEKFRLVRPKYEFFDWFEAILVSGEVRLVKPDEPIFNLMLERIGRRAEECLLVDDSAANIQAAARLGFRTIHFQSPEQLRRELQGMGYLDSRT
jgi:2-haloacid dehalogenase